MLPPSSNSNTQAKHDSVVFFVKTTSCMYRKKMSYVALQD